MSEERATPGRLSSVATALLLLKAFSPEEPEMGITTLAKRLSLANSTVHRLASTLVSEGFLEKNPENGRYRLGLSLFSLGTMVRRRMDVSNQGRPYLEILRESANETVYLAVLNQADVVYLYNMESAQAIRARSYIGERKPAFCTSEGRAILAFSGEPLVGGLLKAGLVARTSKTDTNPESFLQTLQAVRRNGYAVDNEESEEGMCGLAAPIRAANGSVVAAVGLGVPVQRMTKKAMRIFIAQVTKAAGDISTRLGYQD